MPVPIRIAPTRPTAAMNNGATVSRATLTLWSIAADAALRLIPVPQLALHTPPRGLCFSTSAGIRHNPAAATVARDPDGVPS